MVPQFPRVHGANLEGRPFALPDDFEGTINLVLIAFRREQQGAIDTWIPTARRLRRSHPGFRSYELPTISRSVPLARWWLDGAMRVGIPDQEARATTITLYLNKRAFRETLGLPSEQTTYALLVDRAGQILWRAEGRWTEAKGSTLEQLVEGRNVTSMP